jgi:4-hydroxy 2-oxovalerate aldolase
MAYSADIDVRITDSCLRDGSHAVRHQIAPAQVVAVVSALAAAGVPLIEVSHGDGLGGSSFTYGFSAHPERQLIATAVEHAGTSRIAVLLLPGIGTVDDLRAVADLGVHVARIATHCTEADIADEHFSAALELGLEAVGFLMMSHTQPPDVLARQARRMADSGATCVYVVDSAGAMTPRDARARVESVVAELAGDAQVGFHAHENLACGMANTLAAVEAGAVQVDGSTRRMGAGAGNAPTEALAAVFAKLGWRTGIDVLALVDVAEEIVRPIMDRECTLDRLALTLGYAGVYSSFLEHADRAATRYGVSAAHILVKVGERGLVGGQEDLLGEIAAELAHADVPRRVIP